MTKRALLLGAGLFGGFLMITGMECPGKSPLVPDGGGGSVQLFWTMIGGGNRTAASGESFSITHEIVLTDGYAGDRSTYDFTVTGLPSSWQAMVNPGSITCPPDFANARPGAIDPKSSTGCVVQLEGQVPSGQSGGDFPYTVRAQRRGTSETLNSTGTITVPGSSGEFGLRLFSPSGDRTITTSDGYPTDDTTASWEIAVDVPDDFTGTVNLLEAAFIPDALNSQPISKSFSPSSISFANGQQVKTQNTILTITRTGILPEARIGEYGILVRAGIAGESGEFNFTIPAPDGLQVNAPDPGPGGGFSMSIVDLGNDNRMSTFKGIDMEVDDTESFLQVRVEAPDDFNGTVSLLADILDEDLNNSTQIRKTYEPQPIVFGSQTLAKTRDGFVRFERLQTFPASVDGRYTVVIRASTNTGQSFELEVPDGLIVYAPDEGSDRPVRRKK